MHPGTIQRTGAQDNIIILKFGSSVLRTVADLPNVAHEIYRWYRRRQAKP